MRLVNVEKMKELERNAAENGLSYEKMMENAGTGLAAVIQDRFGRNGQKSILGLIGSGNNGGDALVALTQLQSQGWQASAFLLKQRENDPLLAKFVAEGGEVFLFDGKSVDAKVKERLLDARYLLDGVIGTGIRLPLRDDVAQFLKGVKKIITAQTVIAVDCPSGVDCEDGSVSEVTLTAHLTVCMEAVKSGLVKLPAFSYCGELVVVPIGLPKALQEKAADDFVIGSDWVSAHLPDRKIDGHKKTFGTVSVVGGCTNYLGAPVLAGLAAYRAGAGLVTLAVPQIVQLALASSLPECTWFILDDENGVISENAAALINDQMAASSSMVVGPGIGREETTKKFLTRWLIEQDIQEKNGSIGFLPQKVVTKAKKAAYPAIVLDADAIRWLGEQSDWRNFKQLRLVLTPHSGEMAALTGLTIDEIQNDRETVARETAQKCNQVVVLKGALTVVADPSGRIAIVPVANSALAKAGSGDALSGIIAALIGQGMDLFEAACAGAWIHARAGVRVAERQGNESSLLVREIADEIPAVFAELNKNTA